MPKILSDLLLPLRTTNNHSNLHISPTDLDIPSVFLIIILLICRQIKHLLGLGTPFTPIATNSTNVRNHARSNANSPDYVLFALPDISLSMPLQCDTSQQRAFIDAIAQDSTVDVDISSNPALVALYLGGMSEAAMLLLLCKRGCPLRPLGSVKVSHRFEIVDDDACRRLVDGRHLQREKGLRLLARFPRSARKVRKGLEVDVEVTLMKASDADRQGRGGGEARPVFRQEMTILQFVRWKSGDRVSKSSSQGKAKSAPSRGSEQESKPFAVARLNPNLTMRWARFSKDYNPIHVSSILARILGLPGVIAHGNHVTAACFWSLAWFANEAESGFSSNNAKYGTQWKETRDLLQGSMQSDHVAEGKKWTMELKFKSMLHLPAAVEPRSRSDGAVGFDIVNAKQEKVVVEVCLGT